MISDNFASIITGEQPPENRGPAFRSRTTVYLIRQNGLIDSTLTFLRPKFNSPMDGTFNKLIQNPFGTPACLRAFNSPMESINLKLDTGSFLNASRVAWVNGDQPVEAILIKDGKVTFSIYVYSRCEIFL